MDASGIQFYCPLGKYIIDEDPFYNMQEEMQIKAAMKACINDLCRERDKVTLGLP